MHLLHVLVIFATFSYDNDNISFSAHSLIIIIIIIIIIESGWPIRKI